MNATPGRTGLPRRPDGKSDRLAFLRDAYALEAESLLKGLLSHLEDEEDLIIPLLMEQGEDKFT